MSCDAQRGSTQRLVRVRVRARARARARVGIRARVRVRVLVGLDEHEVEHRVDDGAEEHRDEAELTMRRDDENWKLYET